jgi:DNA-directed RNA polymerase alpha subunit
MAILNFVKPDKIVLQKANDFEAQFEFRPLEPGYGVTIGNALRRVLLNSLEGYAIIGINIVGADHEFATIKGITEDVTEIILNLKQVRFKKKVEHEVGTEKITLSLKNKTEFSCSPFLKLIFTGNVIANIINLNSVEPLKKKFFHFSQLGFFKSYFINSFQIVKLFYHEIFSFYGENFSHAFDF